MPEKERAALKEEFGSGIPIQAALNMTSKGIMAEITLTLKDTEIQHLKFLDVIYHLESYFYFKA